MNLFFAFLAALVYGADAGFFMMMMKDGDGRNMMASDSSSAPSMTNEAKQDKSNCLDAKQLENSLDKLQKAEAALELARVAEKEAQASLQACQGEAHDGLVEASQRELAALRNTLQKQMSELVKATDAAERMAKYHQDILSELSEINDNSSQQFQALKAQIDAEMQRQREKLKIDQVTAARIDELEREKIGYAGELKALHQLYNRLDEKYDAKMQQEEEEKLAYFAASLDAEVAKIVGERELEWEANMVKLRTELEEAAQANSEQVQKAHEEEVAALNRMLEDAHLALQQERELASQDVAQTRAAHTKELEMAEQDALQRLDKLRVEMQAEAAQEAAAVQKLHDAQVATLQTEIRQAQEETKRALETSKQVDGKLKVTVEEHERQQEKYNEIIKELKQELHLAHEETAYWMRTFAKRAYFNSTHIAMFAEEARVLAIDKAVEVKQQTQRYVEQQTDQWIKAVDPYTRPVGDFYRMHLDKHVKVAEDAVTPVYDKNVAPRVEQVHLFRRQKTAEFQKMIDDGFGYLVSRLEKSCTTSKEQIDSAPTMIRYRMRDVCKDPAAVIRNVLRIMFVIVVFLLRKPIWKVTWGILKMIASSIWYIISFGFLRKKRPIIDTGTDAKPEEEGTDDEPHLQDDEPDEGAREETSDEASQ